MHSIGEVVKQFEFYVPPLWHPIKGKIVKHRSKDGVASYTWSISHNYKPRAGAGVYYPSTGPQASLKAAEDDFRAYAESFVPEFEVKANESF